jgi:hypothetical protein
MATYPAHFGQGLANQSAATMAYLKAAPTYHVNGLTALGMTAGLESLQTHYSHGGKCLSFLALMKNYKLTSSFYSEKTTSGAHHIFATAVGCIRDTFSKN